MRFKSQLALVFFFVALAWSGTLDAKIYLDKDLDLSKVPELSPEPKHRYATGRIARSLMQQHYKKTFLNDKVSAALLNEYLDMLDSMKVYFLESDIKQFKKAYEKQLDDSILVGRVDEAFEIHKVFMERWLARYDYALGLIKKTKFDFKKREAFFFDRENANWMMSTHALDRYWYKRVKNDYLNEKLAGKEDKEIRELLTNRYNYSKRRIVQSKSQDVFNFYMNALLQTVEPHTSYMSPRRAENFDIDMSLKLQGIGAVLQTDDIYTKVVSLVPKGPADKSKQMKKEDRIIAVGQDDEELVDIVGWRLDDVVALIRGKKGSTVRLEIIPKSAGADANSKVVTIVRDEIKLEEEAAQSEIIQVNRNGQKLNVGVITLPRFYIDFEARYQGKKDYRSTSRDMRKILDDFKKKDVDGVIVDLRNNGGGSLLEATQATGLFIKEGPIVQDRNYLGQLQVHRDDDPRIVYEGPLMVVVNSLSASASEIFAGAIQDYGRGVVVGSQTFGKGTVQNVMSLNNRSPDFIGDLGQLKFTVSKFYRVSGDSTQHKGVVPDILLPDIYDRDEIGESAAKNALPWDQIRPLSFNVYHQLDTVLPKLNNLHKARSKEDKDYLDFLAEVEDYKALGQRSSVSLNELERVAERDRLERKRLERINFRRQSKDLKPLASLDDIDDLEEDEVQFDILKDEFVEIMADFIDLDKQKLMVSTPRQSKVKKN